MVVAVCHAGGIVLGQHVRVEAGVPLIRRLGAEEHERRQAQGAEDGDQVERPPPLQLMGDLAHDDGREEGPAKHRQVRERHSAAALVDEVQVAHGGIDQSLVRGTADALDDAGPEKAGVVLLVAHDAAPGARGDQDDHAEDKGMPFAPHAAGGHEEGTRKAGSEQEVARQDGDVGEVMGHVQRDGNGVGGEYGPEGGGEDGGEGQDEGDEVALPQRPVQRVVGIVGWLGHEDDGHGAAVVGLEAADAFRGELRPLGVVKIAGRPWSRVVSG